MHLNCAAPVDMAFMLCFGVNFSFKGNCTGKHAAQRKIQLLDMSCCFIPVSSTSHIRNNTCRKYIFRCRCVMFCLACSSKHL